MKKKVLRVVIIINDSKVSLKPCVVVEDLEKYRKEIKELFNADTVLLDTEETV